MAFWWVNQGQSFEQERTLGIMWAPLVDGAGHRLRHWDAMTLVAPGDMVFHYADGSIRAISEVTARAIETERPAELPAAWDQHGRLVHVAIHDVSPPLGLAAIPVDLRLGQPTAGPFNRIGGVKQAYLFPLADDFGRQLLAYLGRSEAPSRIPAVYRLNVAAAQLGRFKPEVGRIVGIAQNMPAGIAVGHCSISYRTRREHRADVRGVGRLLRRHRAGSLGRSG
jgi:hypothetical protein